MSVCMHVCVCVCVVLMCVCVWGGGWGRGAEKNNSIINTKVMTHKTRISIVYSATENPNN